MLVGLEALIRWNDPERGLVLPGDFIPIAEETGLIEPIGEWVIEALCAQVQAWNSQGLHPFVSFNVSPRQLKRADMGAHARRQAARVRARRRAASRWRSRSRP